MAQPPPPAPGRTPHPFVKSVMYVIASFVSLTWHCAEFWADLIARVALHRMSESELLGTSVGMLGTHLGLEYLHDVDVSGREGRAPWSLGGCGVTHGAAAAAASTATAATAATRGSGGDDDDDEAALATTAALAQLSLPLFGLGIFCALSVHVWFHLMGVADVGSSQSSTPSSALFALGIILVLVADSVLPWLILVTGRCACWAGYVPWLVGASASAALWALTSFATGLVRFGLYRGLQGPEHGGHW